MGRLKRLETRALCLHKVKVHELLTTPTTSQRQHTAAATGSNRLRGDEDLLVFPIDGMEEFQNAATEAILKGHRVTEVEAVPEEDLAQGVDCASEPGLQIRLREQQPPRIAGVAASTLD